jgi:Icc-related predicted phosphoesterase
MKIAVISDIHSNLGMREKAAEKCKKSRIETVFLLGDLTNEGHIPTMEKIISEFDFAKLWVVPGNMDTQEMLQILEKKGILLHKKSVEIAGICFIGIGGAKPVNTYYRTNLGELEAKKYLAKLFEECRGKKTIMLSHSPPRAEKIDLTASGFHLGMDEIRNAIEKYKPVFSFSGHVHEASGEEKIVETRCINVGPLKNGFMGILDTDGMKFERIKL